MFEGLLNRGNLVTGGDHASRSSLDTVRGLACILLVFYHVVGPDSTSGLRLADDSAARAFNDTLAYVRMPLFTFLSGVVYALRPLRPGGAKRFATGKLKRLAIPFVCLTLLFAIIQKITPGTNAELPWEAIPGALVWPHSHMWFIASLMLVFVTVGAMDYLELIDRPELLLVAFFGAAVLFPIAFGEIGAFAWNRALYLLPFFLAGVMMQRFGWRWALCCVPFGLASMGISVSVGVLAGVLLLLWMPAIPALAWIGAFSYSIYLFHVFGSAGARIVLEKLGTPTAALLLIGTMAGIFLPILLHVVVARVPYLSRALLGIRANPGGK